MQMLRHELTLFTTGTLLVELIFLGWQRHDLPYLASDWLTLTFLSQPVSVLVLTAN